MRLCYVMAAMTVSFLTQGSLVRSVVGARLVGITREEEVAIDDTLCLVNDGNGFLDTGFVLGQGKEVLTAICLVRSTDNQTGSCLIGHNGANDSTDFRLFVYGSRFYADCGKGRNISNANGNNGFYGIWHWVAYPYPDYPISHFFWMDGSQQIGQASMVDGPAFGVTAKTLKLFALQRGGNSQKGAIRRVSVYSYETGEVLCDFLVHSSGRLYDIVNRRFTDYPTGSVSVVPWTEVSQQEGWQ